MKSRELNRIKILFIIFVILFGGVLFVKLNKKEYINPDYAKKILEKISAFTETETLKITFVNQYDSKIIIVRQNDNWVIRDKENYPVEKESIKNFFIELEKIKRGDLVSEKKENFYKYELEETQVTSIILESAKDKIHVIVGKRGSYAGSNYIRIKEEPYALLVPSSLKMFTDKTLREWYKKQITDFNPREITEYKLSKDQKEIFYSIRMDTGWNIVVNEVKKDTQSLQVAIEALSLLRAMDVYVGDELSLTEAELDKPLYTIQFKSVAGRDTIYIGKEIETVRYIKLDSIKNIIFKVSNYTIKQIILKENPR
ncbi:MAG: DUF4340 domain-containing protein [Candidatus Hydrogenedentota bacterium]